MSFKKKSRRTRQRGRRSFGLRLEVLEGRILPATITWTGAAGDNSFQDAGNWDPASVPGAADNAVINATGITITESGNTSVLSIQSQAALDITGGGLTVTAGASSIAAGLTLANGTYLVATGSGTSFSASGTTNVDGANLYALASGSLSLPGLTSYDADGNDGSAFEADGAGSMLDVSALATLTQSNNWTINALSGGTVNLNGMTTLPAIFDTFITDTGGSTIDDINLTSLNLADVTLDGTDANVASSWTSFTGGILEVIGDSYDLSGLTDGDNSSFEVGGGATLSLTGLTGVNTNDSEFSAVGSGSLLDLSSLTAVTQTVPGALSVSATTGGKIDLSKLASVSSSGISIFDTGHSTVVDSKLTSFTGAMVTLDGTDAGVAGTWTTFTSGTFDLTGGTETLSGLSDVAGSSFVLKGALSLAGDISAEGSNVTLYPGATVTVGTSVLTPPTPSANGTTTSLPTLPAGMGITLPLGGTFGGGTTINVPAGGALNITSNTSTFQLGTFTGGTTFNLGIGATITISAGIFTGGAVFNVADNAVVNIENAKMSGTLTGGGGGSVQVDGQADGGLSLGSGGVTLNFPSNVFQWSSGEINAQDGDLINLGMMTVSGNTTKEFDQDGVLDNFGTIIQTGSGTIQLGTDGTFPAELENEAGADYLLEGSGGLTEISDSGSAPGQTSLDNAGTIQSTGSGASIHVLGLISNTGTIEAISGTLALFGTLGISQVSGNTLTGGTWGALSGGTLAIPPGDLSVTANAANLILDGAGAVISGLSALVANSGSLSLTNGANLGINQNFSNSGSITVGVGSTLTVFGNSSQTSSGSLNVQIGGTPGSGQFGQLIVTGAASLAGAFNLTIVNNFMAAAGQDFSVIAFASATGSFAAFTGFGSTFSEALNSATFDVYAYRNAADLSVSNVAGPTAATSGQSITVTWQVTDLGPAAASGSWQDRVYVSPTPSIGSTSVLLGAVVHSGGLADSGFYDGSLTATMPALSVGAYYLIVQADSLYQVPDPGRANNTATAGTGQVVVSVPGLTLGSAAPGTFTAADQDQYYQITLAAGGSLQLALASDAASGALALYVSQGVEPTPYNYQESANNAGQPNQTLNVPILGGTYYILVHSISGAAASSGYTLTGSVTNALAVSAISSYPGGNAGNVTVEIDGRNFTASAAATLTLGGTTIVAAAIDYVSASQIFATFNLTGAAPGSYTLTVQQGGDSASAPTTFQVVAASAQSLNVTLNAPQYIRAGRTGSIVITYANPTDNDMVAPVLLVSSTDSTVSFSTPDDPNNFLQTVQVLAVAPSGPAGILRPGQSGQITLTVLSNDLVDNDPIPLSVSQIESNQSLNLASEQAALQPSTFSTAAWNVVFTNLMAEVGSTTTSYNEALAQAATYLSSLGESTTAVSNVERLWRFLIAEANASFPTATLGTMTDASLPTPGNLSLAIDRSFNPSISGRYQQGIFGLGWTTSWQSALSVDGSGNVTVTAGNNVTYFVLQPGGTYLNVDTEYGTLTSSGGEFTYTAASGTQYVFLPNDMLGYVQDANGNRITLGYNSQNQLVALTYANPGDPTEPGEELTLNYTNGFVSQVADGVGDIWTYTYDADGHLLSVIGPGGLTTTYTYDTGSNPETANALLSITNADGFQENFTYNGQGRLSGASQNSGADPMTFTYGSEAEVTASDLAGDQTTVWFNDLGLPARVVNPLGAMSTYLYDNNGNLVGYTDADGDTYQYSYDSSGNLTRIVNPLGQIDSMTVGALSHLTSIADADNNTTQYGYSSTGNLLSITYPDGTQQSFTYDPLGNLTETIEQNGDPVSFQYNAEGLATSEAFADGSSQTYTYDARGNLLTASSYDTSGTLTGTTVLTYNAASELLSITYPNGQYLDFTYNDLGQRVQSVDQDGFTVNYSYDALGRLSELIDGSNNMIVQYVYNDLGQLVQKNNGTGTYTTYAYDASGNITNEVNYANAEGTVINSSFAYTYNLLGEQTSVTDNSDNVTSYAYDATGQLTQVTLPDGSTIQYVYNAAGDRTAVINSGTSTAYSSNNDNEITQAGSTTFTYDANGNLATMVDNSGTTTYTYNDLNQLVSIGNPDGSVQTFSYSPLGFLTGNSTTSGGGTTTTNYLVDPTGMGNVVAAYDGSGDLIADYVYGLGLVSQSGPSGTGYYDFDASGNTIGITGSSGTYVNQYSYLPFGDTATISSGLPNPFTFVGQFGVLQVGADLFNMRARNLMPELGQFVSNDPLGLAGGDTNFRRYVQNNPLTFVDPKGLDQNPYLEDYDDSMDSLNMVGQVAQSIVNQYYKEQEGPEQPPPPPRPPDFDYDNPPYNPFNYDLPYQEGPADPFNNDYPPAHPPLPPTQQPPTSGGTQNRLPNDPNALVGPEGVGAQGFVPATGSLSYTVDFENDGSVAAQDVTVTEQLDPNLDWSTFQLGSFDFGSVKVSIPAGLTRYETTVNYQNSDDSPLNVLVDLDFNVQTGLLTVSFTSLDPLTGQAPTGVFDGFLPPDDSSHIGEGYVTYTVSSNPQAATGTTINAQASVVFDTNAPLPTNVVSNTILNIVTQASLTEPAGTAAPTAEKISTLLATHYADVDKANQPGIAVFDTSGAGKWQFSTNGTSWTTIAAVSTTNALLLPQADRLRFLPTSPAAGTAELLYVAWDGSTGTAGHYVNASITGGGASFSASAGELAVTLSAVTQAPVWLATAATLTPVLPGGSSNGETVAAAFGSVFSGDNNQSAGIAVVGVIATTNGTWQYALFNSGTQTYGSFEAFPAVSTSKALLLGPNDEIRFVPAKSTFTGPATLTIDAWDQSGTAADGSTVNLSKAGSTGGKTPFSSTSLTGKLYFNNAPTQNPPAKPIPFVSAPIAENAASKSVSVATLLTDAHAADPNKNALGLAVTAASGNGVWQYELSGGAWANVPAAISATAALLLPSTALLRFDPTSDYSGQALLSWLAWDGTQGTAGQEFAVNSSGGATAFSSAGASATLTVTASQHPPVWSGTGAVLTPVQPANSNPPGNTVAAVFGPYFEDQGKSVGIAITAVTGTAFGQWEYKTAAGTTWQNLPSVSTGKALLLSANDLIRFVPNGKSVGTATLTARAWNGAVGSDGATAAVNGSAFSTTTLTATCLVNDAPTLSP